MTSLGTVLDSARTHLGDNQAMDWQDNDIIPKFQEAHRELQLKLFRSGIPLLQSETGEILVPANTGMLDGLTNYPTDSIVEPTWLFEKYQGQTDDNYVDMKPRSYIPLESASTQRLQYWCWQEQHTLVRPCTQPIIVKMRYRKFLPVPIVNTDPIGIIMGETFLSFRTAALCLEQMPGQEPLAAIRNQEAIIHMDDIIAFNVNLNQQMLPARRKPYHRRHGSNYFWGY